MTTITRPHIGLTQFIDFTIKGSSAKTNMVRKIKYQDDYHPAFDYWKQLRESIVLFHQNNLDIEIFDNLVETIDPKKKGNYIEVIKQYKKFIKGKEISWFEPGKATWFSSDLSVRSSSELGLIINGEPHLIKLYFKGKSEKLDKRTISTTLTLLNTATYEKINAHNINCSVLNLHKNKLFTDSSINTDRLIALESEAHQFMFLWDRV